MQNISKTYASHQALTDVSMDIPRGSIFGLLGPNGAGKTTLIRIITNILRQDSGTILFNGEVLQSTHIGSIGYLPEERGLYRKMKVAEQLRYLARIRGMKGSEADRQIGLWFDRFEIRHWAQKKIEDLSKGMQQKIQFIATVMHRPELIILDEPFSGFDPIAANEIKDEILKLRDEGATIIFSTHRMESVEELCDHITLLNNSKKILDGGKQEIRQAHRTNIFEVHGTGTLAALADGYEVLEEREYPDGTRQAEVRIPEKARVNDFIHLLMGSMELISVSEKVPSINDIFIQKVKQPA